MTINFVFRQNYFEDLLIVRNKRQTFLIQSKNLIIYKNENIRKQLHKVEV